MARWSKVRRTKVRVARGLSRKHDWKQMFFDEGVYVIGRRIAVGFVCMMLLTGCASSHAYSVKRADAVVPCQMAAPERDLLLGVALSGGGSRAALYGAAGLEALARVRTADGASLIEKISHLSSVSGGSMAATYYALKKPGRDVKVLDADGALSDAYRTFFEQYRAAVSQNSRRP